MANPIKPTSPKSTSPAVEFSTYNPATGRPSSSTSSSIPRPLTPPSARPLTMTVTPDHSPPLPKFTVTKDGKVFVPVMYLMTRSGKKWKKELDATQRAALQTKVQAILDRSDIKAQIEQVQQEALKEGKTVSVSTINLSTLCIEFKGAKPVRPIYLFSDMEEVKEVRKFWRDLWDPGQKRHYVWSERKVGQRAVSEPGVTRSAFPRPSKHEMEFTAKDEIDALSKFAPDRQLLGLKRRHAAVRLKEKWEDALEDLKAKVPADETNRIETIEKAQSQLKNMWDFALRFKMARPHDSLNQDTLKADRDEAFALLSSKQYNPGKLKRGLNLVSLGRFGEAKEPKNPKAAIKAAIDIASLDIMDDRVKKQATDILHKDIKQQLPEDKPTHDALEEEFAFLAKATADGDKASFDRAFSAPLVQKILNTLGRRDKAVAEQAFKDSFDEIQREFTDAQIGTVALDGFAGAAAGNEKNTARMAKDFDDRMLSDSHLNLQALHQDNRAKTNRLMGLIPHLPPEAARTPDQTQGALLVTEALKELLRLNSTATTNNHLAHTVKEVKDARAKEMAVANQLAEASRLLAPDMHNARVAELRQRHADNQRIAQEIEAGPQNPTVPTDAQNRARDDFNNSLKDYLQRIDARIPAGGMTDAELDAVEPQVDDILRRLQLTQNLLNR